MGKTALLLCLVPILAVAAADEASDAINSFSIDFLKEVASQKEGNVAMSPPSVSTLLAILHQGAEGKTKDQLTRALHGEQDQTRLSYKKLTHSLKNGVTNGTVLEFANAMFVKKGAEPRPEFKQLAVEDFQSDIAVSDFAANQEAAQQINNWVSHHTHDKIKELIKPDMLSEDTRVVLVNAIYFKDLWLKPFRPEVTIAETFYTDTEKRVPMMHQTDYFRTGQLDDLQAQWLEMPFQGERFSMIILLPRERNGLQNMLQQITSEHMSKVLDGAKNRYEEKVILSVPKFKLSTTIKLIPILKPTMPDLFSPDANLSKIIPNERLQISEAIQKAEIEVDELGATAAAATAFIGAAFSGSLHPEPELVFKADHPFLALILDKVNQIPLFAAKVTDPSLS